MEKIEKDVRALDDKLDLILAKMKGNANLPCKSSVYDSDEAEESWEEVKTCGCPKHKTKKLKTRSLSTTSTPSSSSSSDRLESEGETKQFARKRFVTKDFKFKCKEEIVHVCVKTVYRMISQGQDPVPVMKHLKFVSEKVAKMCINLEAVAGYDQAVRDIVVLEGYS